MPKTKIKSSITWWHLCNECYIRNPPKDDTIITATYFWLLVPPITPECNDFNPIWYFITAKHTTLIFHSNWQRMCLVSYCLIVFSRTHVTAGRPCYDQTYAKGGDWRGSKNIQSRRLHSNWYEVSGKWRDGIRWYWQWKSLWIWTLARWRKIEKLWVLKVTKYLHCYYGSPSYYWMQTCFNS